MSTARPIKKVEIEYPSSDGKPMAETDAHREKMVNSIDRLQRFYAGRRVYVSGNLLIYYVEGDPRKSVAPDTFVVKNCRPGARMIFQIWRERRKPNFVLEITSRKTRREDQRDKKTKYALIGVPEYFLYDPFGEWLSPPLQGFSLIHETYESIPPDAEGGVTSTELGIRFVLEDGELAMFDVANGARLLTSAEWGKQQAEEAVRQAEEARQAAHRAEEERRLKELAEEKATALEQEIALLRAALPKTNGNRRKNGKT